ncbi:MAG: hypothetical protein JXR46_06585 [Calditrichaceae bacterium]|nr:hypothetical protein [Calditrichaceae bacterium]MBN2708695.1 hypothetical protein [Calditrichaceae bacterium]RQV92808.1 MAG: hypothetical protein EH224_14275 [Calditrichota bacterium]
MKAIKKPYVFLISGFLILFLVQLCDKDGLDWRPTFSNEEKIPFSAFILYDLLDELFPEQDILISYNSFYQAADSTDFRGSNWIFMNTQFNPDFLDTDKMLNYVSAGNCVFISAAYVTGPLADSLKLHSGFTVFTGDSIQLNFLDTGIKLQKPYPIQKIGMYNYFSSYDTSKVTVLGRDESGKVNFIKNQYGKGFFLLHSVPYAFTNYQILKKGTLAYQAGAFTYLPVQRTIWDEYYKESRAELKSPLKYIFNRQPLRWAYYTSLIGLLLFMVFAARRRQRSIPVVQPPKNDTLGFVKTVAGLYFQHGDHKNLIEKKVTYFSETLRSKLYIQEEPFTEQFINALSAKTGVKEEKVQKLFDHLADLRKRPKVLEKDLLDANGEIDKFKKEANIS